MEGLQEHMKRDKDGELPHFKDVNYTIIQQEVSKGGNRFAFLQQVGHEVILFELQDEQKGGRTIRLKVKMVRSFTLPVIRPRNAKGKQAQDTSSCIHSALITKDPV